MEILMVQLNVDAERIDAFFEASKEVARASIYNEPGCRRFDIVQDLAVPTRVAFVEVFDDEAAVKAHPKFEHYPKWRADTAEGNLPQGQWERVIVRRCRNVFPDDHANFDSVIDGADDEGVPADSLHIIHAALPVKSERVDDFIEAARVEALHSLRSEPGCLRFDLYQTFEEPSLLWLYEVYANQEAFRRRTTTTHAMDWAETVKDWYDGEVPPSYRGPNIWPPSHWGWSSGEPRS